MTNPVRVRWRDAVHDAGQVEATYVHDSGPLDMESVGFLVSDSSGCVVIAQGRTGDGSWVDCLTIPRECIEDMEELR